MFGKFTGYKDPQGTRIYLYGISKVSSSFNGITARGQFFCWFDFLFYKINTSNKEYPVIIPFLENDCFFFAKKLDFQVKIKTLDKLTPISKANKAISNLLILWNSQLFFCKALQKQVAYPYKNLITNQLF